MQKRRRRNNLTVTFLEHLWVALDQLFAFGAYNLHLFSRTLLAANGLWSAFNDLVFEDRANVKTFLARTTDRINTLHVVGHQTVEVAAMALPHQRPWQV